MSFQVCHCGWSKTTTYQGLRIHQGKKGCTPKGMSIPEYDQFMFNTYKPALTYSGLSIKAGEVRSPNGAFLDFQTDTRDFPKETFLPRLAIDQGRMESTLREITMESESSIFKNQLQESHQKNSGPIKEEWVPMSPDLTTQIDRDAADAAVIGMFTSLWGAQQRSLQTAQNSDNTHPAHDFPTGWQPFSMPMSQNLSTQMNPAATDASVKEMNKPFFETQQHSDKTAANLDKTHQMSDFTSTAQPLLMTVSQDHSTQMNPAEATFKETNKTLFESPQHSHQSANGLDKARGTIHFSNDSQPVSMPMSQHLSTQMNPAATDVSVKEMNKPFTETPQRSDKTAANLDKGHQMSDFSTSAKSLSMPVSQDYSTQKNPAEATFKETNKSLFKTPERSHQSADSSDKARRALDFSTVAPQIQQSPHLFGGQAVKQNQLHPVDQIIKELPTTKAQGTAVQPKEKEKEKEKEAQKRLKVKQDKTRADLQQKVQMREQKVAEVRSSMKACTGSLDAEWLEINNVFLEVMRAVEDTRQKALQPLEERRMRVKKEAQDLVKNLQREIDELKKTIDELGKNPNLQVSALTCLDEYIDWKHLTVDTSYSFGTLRTTTSAMMEQIHQRLENLSSVELKRIPTFAVDVKLDPTSAHRCLLLSSDGKKVRDGGKTQPAPDAPNRFDPFGSILGLNRLTTGKSYWEVEVSNKTGWDLGVARGKANRKGELSLIPDKGYWVIVHYEGKNYAALTAPAVPLTLKDKPHRVGVFVDYEERLVSFYNVTAQSHIYSFTKCSFRDELFPYFSPHLMQNDKNGDPLIISAVQKQK
ncbi:uncharacterized protein LOC134006336 [Scomber scombrus]|uniref:uncharacterized protein LOC134006336 n=1 Tax=Scomber scombrus TaxID=13677 RepID=UPI002DD8EC05|nr:uncharacterized protein LOC134006336 [Scomber scombrus]